MLCKVRAPQNVNRISLLRRSANHLSKAQAGQAGMSIVELP
jgi:hypothetical protein